MNNELDPTREAIRREMEETRAAYHKLLKSIPDDGWERPTTNPSWNVRQVLFHITIAYKFLHQDLKMLRGRRFFSPPKGLFDILNDWYTRWSARNQNAESLAAEFDKQHNNILYLIDSIQPDEWELSGTYPNINENLAGEQTIADMFHYLAVHYYEHETEIQTAVA
jgi:hypothetical protein